MDILMFKTQVYSLLIETLALAFPQLSLLWHIIELIHFARLLYELYHLHKP